MQFRSMTRFVAFSFTSALFVTIVLAAVAWAQAITGTIAGTITDVTGAVIPNAKITITNKDNGYSSERTSDSTGQYTAPFLPPGRYQVQAEVPGFNTLANDNVLVQVDQTVRVDMRLEIGQVSNVINVTSAPPLVQSGTSALGEVVERQQIVSLPLNGRLFSQLVALTPGAVQRGFGDFGEDPAAAGARAPVNATVNGLPWSGNNYLIDGVANNEPLNQFINISPPLEAIQEFKVQTNNPTAEFGVFGGALINLTIRSGTNEIHGTAFEYLRNDALNARSFFAPEKAALKTNQFGGTVGGPIKRNKAFLFMDYQGYLQRTGETRTATVPTALERTGDLSELSAQVFNPLNGAPFPGNRIPAAQINPITQQVANLFPLPNRPGLTNNFIENVTDPSNQQSFDVKTDFQISSKATAFARESFSQRDLTTPATGNAFMAGGSTANSRNQNAVAGLTYTFSPNKVSETRIGFNRFAVTQLAPDFGLNTNNQLGIPNGNIPGLAYTSGIARFDISNYLRTGSDGFLDSQRIANTFQYTSNFTWIAGRHTIKFGGDIRRIQSALTNGQTAPRGQFSFDSNYTSNHGAPGTGSSFGSFLLGDPTVIFRDYINTRPAVRMTFAGFFVQDDFRVTQSLTINVGLRWDVFTHPSEKFDRQSNFNLGDGLIHLATNGNSGPDVGTFYKGFAPRIGFAYTPDQGKTAIRGAYGISYFPDNFGATGGTLERNYPFFATSQVTAASTFVPNLSVSQGFPADVTPQIVNNTVSPPAGFAVFRIPSNFRQDMAQMWNFGAQRQIASQTIVDISYVGTRGTHLFRDVDINTPLPGPGDINTRRPFYALNPNITSIHDRRSDGMSYYSALQAKLSKQFSNGFQALVSYTFSKTIDDVSRILDPYNDALNRGLSSGFKAVDIPQNFVVSYSYELPFGKGKRYYANASKIPNLLASGWSVNGITTAHSGEPLVISVANPLLNNGSANIADITCSHPKTFGNVGEWFDTGCFSNPAAFTYGNSNVGHVRGPALVNWDFSTAKLTNIDEKRTLEFRAEFFNIFNQAHFANPATTLGNSDFGVINSTILTPREVQLGLKLVF